MNSQTAKLLRFLLVLFIIHHSSFIISPQANAQGVYKQSYIYAHTFEAGNNTGQYRNVLDANCVKMTNVTTPDKVVTTSVTVVTPPSRRPSGGCDPPGDDIVEPGGTTTTTSSTSTGESQGSTQLDDSFDGGINTRCFSQVSPTEVANGPTGTAPSITTYTNFSLTFTFTSFSAPKIKGMYFEMGQVNMSGVFQPDSKAQYRLVVYDGATAVFTSNVLDPTRYWNKFYVPFVGINTAAWAGKSLRFEIRAWNNGVGYPFFRYDDIALIGSTSCVPAPGKIGNLVWEDTNGDGTADAAEPKLAGVCVDLIQDDGDGVFNAVKDSKIASTVTDASGKYLFDDLFDGKYYVSIGQANFKGSKPLKGYTPTTGAAVGGNSDQDNKDHAMVRSQYKLQGVRSDVITLSIGGEPTTDGDDANGNMTIDFGFLKPANPLNLGNLVWEDADENGLRIPAELGIDGVCLELYKDTDGSGTFSTGDVLEDSTRTTGGGLYDFNTLLPGDYVLVIPTVNFGVGKPLKGYRASRGLDPAPDPDTDPTDNDDNGVSGPGYKVTGKAITLAAGTEPTTDGDGANGNLTYDFGFFFPCNPLGSLKNDLTFGSDYNDVLVKTIATADGGLLLGGYSFCSSTSGDKTVTFGKKDYWIVKTNNLGTKLWEKSYGSTNDETLVSVANTADGGYLLAGNTTSAGVWVVKIDNAGTQVFNTYVTLSGATPWSIDYMESTPDGGFILGNNSSATGIVKIDAAGAKLWTQTYNGLVNPISGGGFLYLNKTNMDVQKLDALGANVWTKAYADALTKPTVAMSTNDGGYLVAGVNGTTSQVRKLDIAGNQVWYQTYPNFSITGAYQNVAGEYILSGTSSVSSQYELAVYKISSAGLAIYNKTYGGTGIEVATNNAVIPLGSSDYWIAGTSDSDVTGNKGSAQKGCNDYWLARFCDGGGIGGKMSLGNLVWNDANNNGIKDAAETPIADVVLDLFVDADADGIFSSNFDVLIKTTKTDALGLYIFDGLEPDTYFVRINKDNFKATKPLYKMLGSTGQTDSNTDTNDKDHGIDTQTQGFFGVMSTKITLTENGEPLNDGDPDPINDKNSNLTIDFGFYTPPPVLCLGNFVYFDKNNNYKWDTGELPIAGVKTELWLDADGDDMLDVTKDTHIGTDQITDAAGKYKYCSLADGIYFVNIPKTNWDAGGPLNGLVSTNSFTGGDFVVDNYDHGVDEMSGPNGYDEINYGVASTSITLATGTEPDVAIDGDDKNGNMTIDFGFYRPVNIGDLVWNDPNRDGIKDAAEVPIPNVQIDLFIDTNNNNIFEPLSDLFYWQQKTFTDGTYVFDRLTEGKYFVRVSPTNFNPTNGVLKDFKPSLGNVLGNSDLNNRDHGIDLSNLAFDGVLSTVVDLAPTTEPASAVDGDGTDGNLTIDFGFGPKCTASITATPTACTPAFGRYDVSGQITVTNAPATGTLVISDGGESITLAAPFTSPISYTLAGLRANGASRNVTFSFSACVDCQGSVTYTAPAACPVTRCSLAVSTTPTGCDGATNNYNVSGNVTFTNAPTTGTLKVSDGTKTQVFNAPFVSPLAYNLTGIGSNGAIHNVVAAFSADTACVNGGSYLAPMSCCPTCCNINLLADAGACKISKQFDITGSVTVVNAPTTGTLTIAGGTKTQVFNAPFATVQAFTLVDAETANQPVNVTATFSAACSASVSLIAPCLRPPIFDLAIKKELVPVAKNPNVQVGSSVTFRISVINQGTVDATNVQVTDYIPTGLTLNDAAWTATAGKATLNTVIASLAVGATVTKDITFTVGTTLGSIRNFAEISAATGGVDVDSTPDNDNTNDGTPKDDIVAEDHKTTSTADEDDHDFEDITVVAAPFFDLAIKKELVPVAKNPSIVVGSSVTFRISVINQGTIDATNVQVTDYIPTGLTLNDAAWTATAGKATLNTVIASLAAGATVTKDITFTVGATLGSIRNFAEISAATGGTDVDSTPDNDNTNDGTPKDDIVAEDHKTTSTADEDDHDYEDIMVVAVPVFDLAIKKELVPASPKNPNVQVGSSVTFRISVINQGNITATNVQVTDYIPTGLTLNDAAWTATAGKATLNTVIASLAAGATVTKDITFTVGATLGSIRNFAEISAATGGTDVDSTPDNDNTNDGTPKDDVVNEDRKTTSTADEDDHDFEDITVVVVPVFDLAIKKELVPVAKNPTLLVGSSVTFRISVINQGNLTATNVQVTDYIPTGLTLNDAAWTATAGKATLNTVIASLAAGATVTKDITFTVGTTLGSIRNFAEISAATGGTDVDSTPDNDNTNDGTPKDDVVNEDRKTTSTADEDDHDFEDITVVCANTSFSAESITATCSGSSPNSDGTLRISNVSNGDKVVYNLGNTYTGSNYAGASTIPANGILVSNLANPVSPQTYTIRVFNGSDVCYKDHSITLSPKNCPEPLTCMNKPVFSAAGIQATCTAGSPIADAKIVISGLTLGDKVGYSTGMVYSGANYATAGAIPADGVVGVALANPASVTQYIVRVFNGDNLCYTDHVVTLQPKTCPPVAVCSTEPKFTGIGKNSTCTSTSSAGPTVTTANNDGKISIAGLSNGDKVGYILGSTYTGGPAYSAATATVGTAMDLLTNIANPSSPVTYTIRVFNGSNTCYIDQSVTISPNCTNLCIVPTYTAQAIQITCNGNLETIDAKLSITGVSNGDKVGYSTGSSYTGAAYAGASTIPANGILVSNLANPAISQQYTIRVFNGKDGCFKDTTVTLSNKVCVCPDVKCLDIQATRIK